MGMSKALFTACWNSLFILFKIHYLAKDGFFEFGFLVFPKFPRNQWTGTSLSTSEAQTSGQKNGMDFRVNAP